MGKGKSPLKQVHTLSEVLKKREKPTVFSSRLAQSVLIDLEK